MKVGKVWNSKVRPYSLISMGSDVLVTQNHNVICFTNTKTNTECNYHAFNETEGCGVSVISAHANLSLFAFAEKTIRPILRVVNYPEFTVISKFDSPDVIQYTDLCFSKTEHLIAQTSYPNYTIRVLNYRLNQILVELKTDKICLFNSLLCSNAYLPTIVQFSKGYGKLYFYELCYQSEGYLLLEVSNMSVQGDQEWSHLSNKCFTDDNSLYLVNDYGDIFNVDIGLFDMKIQWVMPRNDEFVKPRQYILENAKRGLIIANTDSIHFIKRKANEWQEEFKILNVENIITNIISNCEGDLFMINSYSNIYTIDNIDGVGVLESLSVDHFEVKEFAILQGGFEEVVIILTTMHELRAYDLKNMSKMSQEKLDNIVHLCAHSKKSFIIAATNKNQMHFLSYEKPTKPKVLHSIDFEKLDVSEIKSMKMNENGVIVRNVFDTLYIFFADFESSIFRTCAYFDKTIPEMVVLDYFVIDFSNIIVLYTLEPEDYLPYSNQLMLYNWSLQRDTLNAQRYELPFNYVRFTITTVCENDMFILYGARINEITIDIFNMNASGTMTFTDSIQTHHLSHIYNIALSRHLITTCVSRTYISYFSQNKSKKSFISTKLVDKKFLPGLPTHIEECFSGKYILSVYQDKCFQVQNIAGLSSVLEENTLLPVPPELENIPVAESLKYKIELIENDEKPQPTEVELNKRDHLLERIDHLSAEVRDLIDYDISVAGMTPRIFRKFCLNYDWLEKVTKEATSLCTAESQSIKKATQDQNRIKDWMLSLFFSDTLTISSKIRALFTNLYCENYSNKKNMPLVQKEYDLFRFHDMEPPDDELDKLIRESHMESSSEDITEVVPAKARHLYHIRGTSVYDHVMADEFSMQSKHEVSYYQMHNTCTKFKLALNNPLRDEFNKFFDECVELKHRIMDNINSTNEVLYTIYENANIMRRLLGMNLSAVPTLTVPQWARDENLEGILTVNDSEIKAINRHKKKAEMQEIKTGRMLLWAFEFWERALMNMMDGVLEKLWEEEIKKDIPEPEFVSKKEPHEFSITEQRIYRDYLEKVRLLELDRRKYLDMLAQNDMDAQNLKKKFILKLNERITILAIEKLQYDFALKKCRLQLINTKIIHFKRIQFVLTLNMMREDFGKISDSIININKVCSHFEKSVADIKSRLEIANNRDRTVERNFKNNFLNNIAAQFLPEIRRLYKKTPKINKNIISIMICDLIKKLVIKKGSVNFLIPQPVEEFLKIMDELDNPHNMPHQFDPKQWEQFVKLRRQKVENEFVVKAISLKLLDIQSAYHKQLKNQNMLKIIRNYSQNTIDKTKKEYKELLHNRSLVITLNLGQVEVKFSSNTRGIANCILMRIEDIDAVNAKIKAVGLQKLKAMQRVAIFRRQVLSKEWEHEVTKANIVYLKYMIEVIEKSKVTTEFLNVLRNWKKVKSKRKSKDLIEVAIEKRIISKSMELQRYIQKMDHVREKIRLFKRKNSVTNVKIEQLKIDYALTSAYRDHLGEEKRVREQRERMSKIKAHRNMMETVRADYARILELKTILELQRLRTYPTLGPAPTKISTSEGSICLY